MTEVELRSNLSALADLLERHGVDSWAPTLRKKSEFAVADCELLRYLKSLFGGMGSLNDIYICQENGHRIAREEMRAVNKELNRLSHQLYTTIQQLNSEFGCDGT